MKHTIPAGRRLLWRNNMEETMKNKKYLLLLVLIFAFAGCTITTTQTLSPIPTQTFATTEENIIEPVEIEDFEDPGAISFGIGGITITSNHISS